MNIFSWNVNGLRAVEKKGNLAKFLTEKNPDIVCFQEIKIDESQLLKENFAKKYNDFYKFFSHAERKGYAGTAIWSKNQPNAVLRNFPNSILEKYNLSDNFGNATKEGRICAADFGDFWLVTVYTPNTKNDLSRLKLREEWDAAFLDFVKGLRHGEFCRNDFSDNFEEIKQSDNIFAPKSVLFCGDLNVAHQEIDLANPKANRGKHGFTDEERSGFDNFLETGFKDIFRNQHKNEPNLYTWWSHFAKSRERNVGWRIDYFLADLNSDFRDKHQPIAKIHPEIIGSDHCPVSIEWNKNV